MRALGDERRRTSSAKVESEASSRPACRSPQDRLGAADSVLDRGLDARERPCSRRRTGGSRRAAPGCAARSSSRNREQAGRAVSHAPELDAPRDAARGPGSTGSISRNDQSRASSGSRSRRNIRAGVRRPIAGNGRCVTITASGGVPAVHDHRGALVRGLVDRRP